MSPRRTNSNASSPLGDLGSSRLKPTPFSSTKYSSVPVPLLLRPKIICLSWYMVNFISQLSKTSLVMASGAMTSRPSLSSSLHSGAEGVLKRMA